MTKLIHLSATQVHDRLPATYPAELLTQCQMCFMHGIIAEYIIGNKVALLDQEAETLNYILPADYACAPAA